MKKHNAFTMIELIFVIVVMGIMGKFGVEFLAQSYKSFIFTNINNQLQSDSESAVEFVSKHLENRIKDSAIVREEIGTVIPVGLGSVTNGTSYKVLEWVGSDNDGFRGLVSVPTWSGIIDLDAGIATGTQNILISPATNTANINTMIQALSYTNTTVNSAAFYLVGSNSDVLTGYGWNGNVANINNQLGAMHPINSVNLLPTRFTVPAGLATYANIDIYEYYKLAWTAYAIVYEPGTNDKGTLRLYWNYQPWLDESFSLRAGSNVPADIQSSVIMENVSTFKFVAIGSLIKIQVCVKSDIVEDYALCKEKTVF